MDTTHAITITPLRRLMAGLYEATVTLGDGSGREATLTVERGAVGINCEAGDGGWWRIITDGAGGHECGDWDHASMRCALAFAQSLRWHPRWGLVSR